TVVVTAAARQSAHRALVRVGAEGGAPAACGAATAVMWSVLGPVGPGGPVKPVAGQQVDEDEEVDVDIGLVVHHDRLFELETRPGLSPVAHVAFDGVGRP